MAQNKRESLKRAGLLTWLAICVLLIGLILVNGLSGQDAGGEPGFYRGTLESRDAINQAQTEAAEYFATPEADSRPGGGSGAGGSGNHPTTTPTPNGNLDATQEAIPTIEG